MSSHSIPTRRGGFSLIEVAIALAIFVFGALAIVQIFPPALGVIRNNESRVTATEQAELALTQSPEAIYAVELDDNGNLVLDAADNPIWQDIPYAVVGTPSKNNSLPGGQTQTEFETSALNHFRYIRGERHSVSKATLINKDTEEEEEIFYVLLNYPYHPNTIDAPGMIRAFKEVVLEGVQIDGQGNLDFNLASEPAIKEDVIYYVSYRWKEGPPGDETIRGVVDEPFRYVNSGGDFDKRVLQGWRDSSENRILAGSITVRYKEEVTLALPEPDDGPIEKVGMLRVPEGTGGVLSFDYLVDDWRTLITRRWSETDTNGIISLPIQNPLFEEGQIYGLDRDFDPADRSSRLSLVTPIMTSPQHTRNAKRGILDYGEDSEAVKRAIRTSYRTVDGWAQQLSVAAKSYIPFYNGSGWTEPRSDESLPPEPWREYFWPEGENRLIFHPSEAGKTISVTYVNGDNEIVDVVLTIDKITPEPAAPNDFFDISTNVDREAASVTITDVQGEATNVKSILAVKGLSIQTRMAWQEGNGRYNQVILTRYRTLAQ